MDQATPNESETLVIIAALLFLVSVCSVLFYRICKFRKIARRKRTISKMAGIDLNFRAGNAVDDDENKHNNNNNNNNAHGVVVQLTRLRTGTLDTYLSPVPTAVSSVNPVSTATITELADVEDLVRIPSLTYSQSIEPNSTLNSQKDSEPEDDLYVEPIEYYSDSEPEQASPPINGPQQPSLPEET